MTVKFFNKVPKQITDTRAFSNKIFQTKVNNLKENEIKIYDTTLRDGNQGFGVNFSIEDKLKIARKLSDFGVHYIEGGWPSSTNITEIDFFKKVRLETIKSKITVVGMTRRPKIKAKDDGGLKTLFETKADCITIVGKSWKLHVNKVLETTLEENVAMIADSISYLKSNGYEVFFDAEHYFDGFKQDQEYALMTVKAAQDAGAAEIILCDTRGSSLPDQIYEITTATKKITQIPIGIHAHNDRGLATANSIFALMAGATHFQGTINGIGERCGNANLVEFVGNLEFSLGIRTNLNLKKLTSLSDYVYEISNQDRNHYLPFVGKYAFAHKGGIHGHAVSKISEAYESIDPSAIGNERSIVVSSQAGLTNVISKGKEFGFDLKKNDPKAIEILKEIKTMEALGYNFENANASLNLIYAKALGKKLDYFNLVNWRAFVIGDEGNIFSEGVVKLSMDDRTIMTAAEGNGPVNAFDIALKKALESYYPELSEVSLTGYRVREINVEKGTAAAVQVFIEFKAKRERWSTVGVSANILEASEEALIAGYLYYLYKQREKSKSK